MIDKIIDGQKKIGVVGNYLPRRCGLATFTTDVSKAIRSELGEDKKLINIAMNDREEGYDYPSEVKLTIQEDDREEYIEVAHYLNENEYGAVIIQHEYGIYGGEDGEYIIELMKRLEMPVLTNLHTVLENPSLGQRKVMNDLAKYSEKLLVMSKKAFDILMRVYGIPKEVVAFVPHGIPDTAYEEQGIYNDAIGLEGKEIILTFGLLGPGKGLEVMIEAMPAIVKKNPNAVYLILGKTHPHILKKTGDVYREKLKEQIRSLNLEKNVVFHNKFVDLDILVKYIKTSTIYSIPYLNREQITSGTLAYALGSGAAVVSTPFWHAEELLAEGRGVLVPFRDSESLAREINMLLADSERRQNMRRKAYDYARSMIWPKVAKSHLKIIGECKGKKKINISSKKKNKREDGAGSRKILNKLPEIDLSHLKILTDDTGILQHAKYTIPDLTHGYCVDDNARALIATSMYYNLRENRDIYPFIQKYLAFLNYSFDEKTKRFANFMSYDRRWQENIGSQDSHGRALWALGVTYKNIRDESIRAIAMDLFTSALSVVTDFTSPRAWAFTVLGLSAYLEVNPEDTGKKEIKRILAEKIHSLYRNTATNDWVWCEESATYSNGILPHALILAGEYINDKEMYNTGIQSLKWLLKIQTAPEGHLSVIGNEGWFNRDKEKAAFGQQPVEAMCLLNACLDVYRITRDRWWLNEGNKCMAWFFGENDLNTPLYNYDDGGCRDGLDSHGVSKNQGAESTLAGLISLINIHGIAAE
ncbi:MULTISPECIES: glycosyltransferase family 4 protein [Psychrilyobacter]|uniref:Glycosyltransferase n=1 Tax=Psychrilyobacter piezotolerans TaxID=2293438 RepID=A0ABX9KFU1_9FUSO|nr:MULTISPECIES: glycosyltransferase family 4 protein [Psychrilyobacter]MCS5420981.1 glycosyltransferase family 4 protein [Psychrilyobacter sp. S5]NDI78782.1 glycosyltransferase [Psychrilyobacter piezotolerans]RDE60882.1 glycosyltransferase [Psychrilyobacter sp. S5]REI40671.1 glycosyltransferase [Psychrilyobacter piezotolerans]